MSLAKRGRYWHYDFVYKKTRFQGSTGQTNLNRARLVESKLRSDAALRFRGLLPPEDAPPFRDFMEGRFLSHVRRHNAPKPATVDKYTAATKRLLEFLKLAKANLAAIDETLISAYVDHRLKCGLKNNSVNVELATLRKALALALEWRLIQRKPKVRMLPPGPGRKFVLTGEMENAYLAVAKYPLREAAILMLDCGLRVGECLALRYSDITDEGITVQSGKTKHARRMLSHTARTRDVVRDLRRLWWWLDPEPQTGAQETVAVSLKTLAVQEMHAASVSTNTDFLFPAIKEGRHLTKTALELRHLYLRRRHGFPAEFVLHSMRHTYGTRLAESGASPFEIKDAMGHSSIKVSEQYVHPSTASVGLAMARKEMFDRVLRGETVPSNFTATTDKEPISD